MSEIWTYPPRPSIDRCRFDGDLAGVARALFRFSVLWLVVGIAAGLSYAFYFVPELGMAWVPANPVHSPGRLRMAHTAAMFYGFVLNAFLAVLCVRADRRFAGDDSAGSRYSGDEASPPESPARSRRAIAWFGFWLIQVSLGIGILGVLHGRGRSFIWGELPLWADLPMVAGWLAIAFALSSGWRESGVRDSGGETISGLWIGLAFVLGPLGHIVWSLLPFFPIEAASAARLAGFFQAQLVHLFLFPLAVGALLFAMPLRLGRPMLAPWLAVGALVLLAVCGPLAGGEIYVSGVSDPRLLAAVRASTIFLGLVWLVLGLGFVWTLRTALREGGTGHGSEGRSRSMLWYALGWFALLAASGEQLMLAYSPFLETLRYTDWIAAHHHLIVAGAFGSWTFGFLDDFWPRLRGRQDWRSPLLADLHLALTAIGLAGIILTLAGAGWAHAALEPAGAPWSEFIRAERPFWMGRIFAGSVFTLAQAALLVNLAITRPEPMAKLRPGREERDDSGWPPHRPPQRAPHPPPPSPPHPAPPPPPHRADAHDNDDDDDDESEGGLRFVKVS